MPTIIIYRSHIRDNISLKSVETVVARTSERNERADVTGTLLFNGTHLFQLIGRPEGKVRDIYRTIVLDPCHYSLVELFCDYAPSRRFGKVGMELFDLWEYDREGVLQTVMDRGATEYQFTYDDRALQFFRTFVESTEKANYLEIPSADSWAFIPDKGTLYPDTPIIDNIESWSFAFQPIVDPFACEIIPWEALLCTPDGQSSGAYFAGLTGDDIYFADLHNKRAASSLAGKLGLRNKALNISLLPMTLVEARNAVASLLDEISRNDLIPKQIIVEFAEREAILRMADFTDVVRKLKGVGTNLATDHPGAGFAGLSLPAQYQLDRTEIDHELIRNTHQGGPRQSTVQAITKCCTSLEIAVPVVGVERAEGWMWLESAGISQFQGDLLAGARLRGLSAVAWSEKK